MNFLQAFVQKLAPSATVTPETVSATPEAPVRWSELMQQYAPLIELQQRRQLIGVKFDHQMQDFQTLVLDINFSQNLMIIDELFPSWPQPVQGQQLCFSHQRQGQLLQFYGTMLGQQTIGGSPCYLIGLPQTIGYRQRRRHPRLDLSNQLLPIQLQSPARAHWFARLLNLSASGLRLQINGDKSHELNRGSRLPRLDLILGRDTRIQLEGLVRSYRFVRRPARQTEISVEFTGLTPEHYALLSQYVDRLLAQTVAA